MKIPKKFIENAFDMEFRGKPSPYELVEKINEIINCLEIIEKEKLITEQYKNGLLSPSEAKEKLEK